jgi:ATP-dependent helicase HepA
MAFVVGQRWMSEREPELGLGVIVSADRLRVGIEFPATKEKRLYAVGTPVLKRVSFRVGETVTTRAGSKVVVESVTDEAGLLVYAGHGKRVREDDISDVTSVSSPQERLMAGQTDPGEVFALRHRALQMQARLRQSEVRGFLGGRLELIPHQFYILQEVASRQIPRVLLADEVGLGKTIEACLIVQRLLVVGQAKRVLILVPESLTHQWFVELLRRFNLWFSIYDAERCAACEQSEPGQNPFLAAQWALASVAFLAGNEIRREQAVAAGWDMVVVDEAHHLDWAPDRVSPEYAMVEELARRVPGLLLLTATPTQLGLAGHFARLRLLDPARYDDYERFVGESGQFGAVAAIADKIVARKPLLARDQTMLRKLFSRDLPRLDRHLEDLKQGRAGAHDALLRTLLDQHGTGRVVFRNTRAAMTGFPKRKFCPAPLKGNNPTLLARIARELHAEETGGEADVRYSFKDDPRIDWLVALLQKVRPAKVLLICKSQRKVLAIEAALQERVAIKVGLFHEDGAQLLICSEIGSEGRNFQFAHHLVLFDLPLNPGLLEQRIGRLDRIGQTQTINIHVPCVTGSAEECVLEWYHHGLDALEMSLQGGNEYQEKFGAELLALAGDYGHGRPEAKAALKDLIARTAAFREELSAKMKAGRDRLLELNSFNPEVAARVIEQVRAADADPALREFLFALLDHFGVRLKEDETGEVFLDPSHAYVEAFPSIPADGMLATFDRARAMVREDIRFLSADHALVQDAIDLLVNTPAGTTAFGRWEAEEPNLLVEAIFVLETVAETRWHVDRFLAPQPVRVLVDVRGRDLTTMHAAEALADEVKDGVIQRFLEQPMFTPAVLQRMMTGATALAEAQAKTIKSAAHGAADAALTAAWQRLVDLRTLNDHVRPEEVALAQEKRDRTLAAIEAARVRLDALRLIVVGPGE